MTSLLMGLAITAAGLYGADNSLGTWKLNVAKSKGDLQIKSQTDVREAAADGTVNTSRTGQLKDGTAFSYSMSLKYDGKKHPVTGAPFDTIAVKRIDENTTSFEISKSGGKLHMTGTSVVSKDGKSRTMTSKGTDADGKPVSSTMVFEKQ